MAKRPSNDVKGPVAPSAQADLAQRPLGIDAVAIVGGPFGHWQERNRDVSIPLGLEQLETAGNLRNLRIAAGEETAEFHGRVFADSDLYKQLEAAAWELARNPDDGLRKFIAESAELLERVQQDDGYLNSYVQVADPDGRYQHLERSHEMYCAGHLFQAAVASARASGQDDRLLRVARNFADHLIRTFLRENQFGIDGHPEVETALVELYRLTGERSYLDLAAKLINGRGYGRISTGHGGSRYLQDHQPVREAETLVGHAVRALYLEAGIVDLAVETGDQALLDASTRRWNDMVATKTYLTGGLGSRHRQEAFGDAYELPPDRAYTETCAAIASIHWSWRLLLATGESKYADLIERTLYNGFAAATSADGRRFFYVNPLQRRADHFEADDPGRRHEWFDCACCPPNIMRLVASLGHYVAGRTSSGVYLHQYVPGTVTTQLEGGAVKLTVATGYPWTGTITVTIDETPAAEWTMAFRIPPWSKATRITVDDQTRTAEPDDQGQGYLTVHRQWRAGESVTLELDLTPRLVFPHPRIDAVRGTVALERGPLVYCFEQVDQPEGVDLEEIVLAPDAVVRAIDDLSHPDLGRTVRLDVEAETLALPKPAGLPYLPEPASQASQASQPVRATAIPYFQWDNRDGGAMRVWLPLRG